eukprot:116069-Prymnesium_polylepis.1
MPGRKCTHLGSRRAATDVLEADETPMSFPASALRGVTTWLIDEDSAVLLSDGRASRRHQ